MENKLLTLAHLETLSSADLIALADDYGIDIPDDLNRRFIIGELLEVTEETKSEEPPSSGMNEDAEIPEENQELPDSFNETEISVILRNPAWAFVYWDISEEALKKISESPRFKNIVLRVSYFDKEEDVTPVEYYDLQITLADREQYILLESGSEFDSNTLQWVVAGIGINFDSDISSFPEEIKERASSLFDTGKATVTKNMLIAKILERTFDCQPE